MENSNKKKSLYLKIIKVVALIGIILIPTIYTTVFLGSMWDPYGKLNNLPVAVVNLDKEVSYNNKSLAVGNELVNNLRENNSLNFNFVDEQEAQKGLDEGSYYMVITIPENFSSNATTLLEENPKKMELQYKTNPGKNYIASKMSESAIKQIASAIENSVTETYAKSVFDEFASIGDRLNTAADGASQIKDGLTALDEGTNKISSNLNLLYNSSLTFTDGMNTLNSKVPSLSSGATALNSGSQSLYNGLQSYTDGVNSLESGANLLNSNSSKLISGSEALESNLSNLETGSNQLLTGLNTMSTTLGGYVNEEKNTNINKLSTSLTALNSGISNLDLALQNGSNNKLTNDFTSLGGNLTSFRASLYKSNIAINSINSKIEEIKTQSWFTALDSETQESIISGLSTPLKTLGNELTNMGTEVGNASTNLGSAVSNATTISEQIGTIKTSVATISENSNLLLPQASSAVSSLYSGLENVKNNLDSKIIPGITGIASGSTQLKDGSRSLASGIKDYTNAVNSISEGASKLNSNSSLILGGAKELSNGINTLSSSVPALTSGISQLTNGSNLLSDGVSKLYDGSLQLSEGTVKLVDGSETLADKLKDGAESASSTKLSDSSREMFASPVNTSGEYHSNIENNGSAMSAYMMSVGLWVGCLALCILFSTDKDIARGRGNLKSYWTKKALKLASLATAQAVIMLTAIIKLNGLKPAYVGKTYLVAIVTGLSFMAIVYFMNLLLGKVGSFILLVFMMLQLSGSAGTYPIELSGKFFNSIHKYVPFTYSVDGFRNGLSTGQSVTKELMVLGIIGLICAIISIFVVIKKSASTKVSLTELIEEAM